MSDEIGDATGAKGFEHICFTCTHLGRAVLMGHRSSLPRLPCQKLLRRVPPRPLQVLVVLQRDAQKHQGLTRGRGLGEGWHRARIIKGSSGSAPSPACTHHQPALGGDKWLRREEACLNQRARGRGVATAHCKTFTEADEGSPAGGAGSCLKLLNPKVSPNGAV